MGIGLFSLRTSTCQEKSNQSLTTLHLEARNIRFVEMVSRSPLTVAVPSPGRFWSLCQPTVVLGLFRPAGLPVVIRQGPVGRPVTGVQAQHSVEPAYSLLVLPGA